MVKPTLCSMSGLFMACLLHAKYTTPIANPNYLPIVLSPRPPPRWSGALTTQILPPRRKHLVVKKQFKKMSHIPSIRRGSQLPIRRHDYLAILRVGSHWVSLAHRLVGCGLTTPPEAWWWKRRPGDSPKVVWQIFGQKDPPPDWFILILNAVSRVSPKADHETNKGVPKALAVGLYFARTKHRLEMQVWTSFVLRRSKLR